MRCSPVPPPPTHEANDPDRAHITTCCAPTSRLPAHEVSRGARPSRLARSWKERPKPGEAEAAVAIGGHPGGKTNSQAVSALSCSPYSISIIVLSNRHAAIPRQSTPQANGRSLAQRPGGAWRRAHHCGRAVAMPLRSAASCSSWHSQARGGHPSHCQPRMQEPSKESPGCRGTREAGSANEEERRILTAAAAAVGTPVD